MDDSETPAGEPKATLQSPHLDERLWEQSLDENPISQSEDNNKRLTEITTIISTLPTVFPKPLAFSYSNFNRYYTKHECKVGEFSTCERMEVAAHLVTAMLRWYFPAPQYDSRAFLRQEELIEQLPVNETRYFLFRSTREPRNPDVTHTNASLQGKESLTSLGKEPRVELGETPAFLLVAVVVEPAFIRSRSNTEQTELRFSKFALDKAGHVFFAGPLQQGYFVLLGGRAERYFRINKVRYTQYPQWEFFSFRARPNGEQSIPIIPWSGEDAACSASGKTVFSLETAEAEKVHQMFESIKRLSTPHHPQAETSTLHTMNQQSTPSVTETSTSTRIQTVSDPLLDQTGEEMHSQAVSPPAHRAESGSPSSDGSKRPFRRSDGSVGY